MLFDLFKQALPSCRELGGTLTPAKFWIFPDFGLQARFLAFSGFKSLSSYFPPSPTEWGCKIVLESSKTYIRHHTCLPISSTLMMHLYQHCDWPNHATHCKKISQIKDLTVTSSCAGGSWTQSVRWWKLRRRGPVQVFQFCYLIFNFLLLILQPLQLCWSSKGSSTGYLSKQVTICTINDKKN